MLVWCGVVVVVGGVDVGGRSGAAELAICHMPQVAIVASCRCSERAGLRRTSSHVRSSESSPPGWRGPSEVRQICLWEIGPRWG